MSIIMQAVMLVVTDQLNIIMMQDFKASRESDIAQVAMTQMLNKLEAVLLMVLHSVDQDMILVDHHMDMVELDLILVDIAHLEHQHMLDLLEDKILVVMDKILVVMDKISVHKLDMISVGMDKILEDTDKILELKDMILVLKQAMISEVLKLDMILEVLQVTHKLVMILAAQDMVDMIQMLNKSVMDHTSHQELEIVDGKYHQVMV
jgi:hypothetical protein